MQQLKVYSFNAIWVNILCRKVGYPYVNKAWNFGVHWVTFQQPKLRKNIPEKQLICKEVTFKLFIYITFLFGGFTYVRAILPNLEILSWKAKKCFCVKNIKLESKKSSRFTNILLCYEESFLKYKEGMHCKNRWKYFRMLITLYRIGHFLTTTWENNEKILANRVPLHIDKRAWRVQKSILSVSNFEFFKWPIEKYF